MMNDLRPDIAIGHVRLLVGNVATTTDFFVRDHRVATCDRRRSWRLAALTPFAFSSGPRLISPL